MLASAVSLLGLLALPALAQDAPAPVTPSQSLAMAIANNSDLSSFANIMVQYPDFLSLILPANSTGNVTVLIPNNAAFAKADATAPNGSILNLGMDRLVSIFKYHVVVAPLTSSNFSATDAASTAGVTGGITVPTLLKDEAFNNRSAAPQLAARFGADATGQVLFVSRDPISDRLLRVRQSVGGAGGASVNLRSGLGATVNLTVVDGVFSQGIFQVVDAVLTPPGNCSTTIRTSATLAPSLGSLDEALDKAGIWNALDTAKNVTCLAPTSAAFAAAGNPEAKLNATTLANALLFHTLPLVTYSNFMVDGQIIKSLSGELVKITLKNNDIFFNDAKVVAKNVLTNNGLIHVLDRVMSPLPANETGGADGGSGGSGGSGDKPNAATPLRTGGGAVLALAVAAASLLVL